jgi:hypothetical protein
MALDKHFIVIEEITNRDLMDAMNNAWDAGYGIPTNGPCVMPAATIEGSPFGGWVIMERRPLTETKPYELPPVVTPTKAAVVFSAPAEAVTDRVAHVFMAFSELTNAEQIQFVKGLPDAALRAARALVADDLFDEELDGVAVTQFDDGNGE